MDLPSCDFTIMYRPRSTSINANTFSRVSLNSDYFRQMLTSQPEVTIMPKFRSMSNKNLVTNFTNLAENNIYSNVNTFIYEFLSLSYINKMKNCYLALTVIEKNVNPI